MPGTDRHFHLGAAVRALDGPVGTLHGLVVDRPTIAATRVIIRSRGPGRALLTVPMTRVVVPMGERLVLGMAADELRTVPPSGEDVLQMSSESLIECDGEFLGRLDCILVSPQTHRVTNLIVRAGLLLGHDLIIPVGWVQAILGYRIIIQASKIGLVRLERFATHREAAQRAAFDPPP